jgi:hypothetical protein
VSKEKKGILEIQPALQKGMAFLKSKYALAGAAFMLLLTGMSSFFLAQKVLNEKDLSQYISVADNGLIKEKNIGDVKLKVLYKPSDLLVAQELRTNAEENIEALKKKYQSYYYFILSISKQDSELERYYVRNGGDFSNKVEQLSFGMGQFLKIITSENDTLSMVDYVYPRMYGATRASSFILIFNNEKIRKSSWFDLYFKYPDLEVGKQKFRFITSDIERCPQLDFKNN